MKRPKLYDEVMGNEADVDPTEQERRFAREIGGRRHRGSGASQYAKGDGSSGKIRPFDGWLYDSKQTKHSSFRVTADDLAKLTKEAMAVEKFPVMEVLIKGEADPILERTWVTIPKSQFLRLLRLIGEAR